MTIWGRRKDTNQPYVKSGKKGISSFLSTTNPLGDIHYRSNASDISYKETNGFLHQNELKIDIYDSKSKENNKVNPKFIAEVRRAWNESPIETRNKVKRIIFKKIASDNYGFVARWKESTKTLTFINLPSTDLEEVSGVVKHELDHVWYTEKQARKEPEIIEYQKKTDSIKPVTYYAQEWYDVWQEHLKNHRKNSDYFKTHEKERKDSLRALAYDANEYYNEQHSETGYLLDLYLKGYGGFINGDRENLAEAIKFYIELHPDIKKPVLDRIIELRKKNQDKF